MYIICNLYLQLMNILDFIFYRTLFLRFFPVAPPLQALTRATQRMRGLNSSNVIYTTHKQIYLINARPQSIGLTFIDLHLHH